MFVPSSLTLPTSAGTLTIPSLGGSLTLDGHDSKIHVVDYTAGSTTLLYSTGEIMTWYASIVYVQVTYNNSPQGRLSTVETLFLSMAMPENCMKPPLNSTALYQQLLSSRAREPLNNKQSQQTILLFSISLQDRQLSRLDQASSSTF